MARRVALVPLKLSLNHADGPLMGSTSRRRVPGVLVLLLAAGSLLLVPFGLTTRATVGEFSERLEAANEIDAHLDDVERWLLLSSALSAEATATSGILIAKTLPAAAAPFITTDFVAILADTRLAVDTALDVGSTGGGAESALADQLGASRFAIDGGELTAAEAVGRLLDLSASIQIEARSSLLATIEVVGRAGGAQNVARSAEVAHAAVDLSVLTSDAAAMWGVVVNPSVTPSNEAIARFVGTVARRDAAVALLDASLTADTPIAWTWMEWRSGEDHEVVEAVYDKTLTDLTVPPATLAEPSGELTPELVAEFVEAAAVVQAFEREASGAYLLAEEAVADVAAANEALQRSAATERTRTVVLLAAFLGTATLVTIWLGASLVRPLRRLGAAAAALSHGDFSLRAPVGGPAELRSTAGAMNDALDSLQRAEAKANALAAERFDDAVFDDHEGPLATSLDAAVARLVGSMTEREALREQLAHDATHDGLTLLRNRDAVLDLLDHELDDASRSGDSVALLYLDLDGFKAVNDTHGHLVGDTMLRTIASRLAGGLEDGEVAGRIGGDEIVVFRRSSDGESTVMARAEEIRQFLSEPVDVTGMMLSPGVSVGVAIADRSGVSRDELMRRADLALYQAKKLGRGRVQFCDARLRQHADERVEFDAAIATGLAEGEFTLHYQPMFDARSNELRTTEALLRWNRNGKSVSPADVIAQAERSELVIELDRWVLHEAMEQAARWTDHPDLGSAPISVNISGRHVSRGPLADDVLAALRAFDVDPARLMLELTETSIMSDLDHAAAELARLSAAGIRIALDDFGTGFMSLATLRRLGVDVMKIDRSFVTNLGRESERSLLDLMVRTGHALGVEVVVEGVETTEQRHVATDVGADMLQGFLLARPVPAAEVPVAVAAAREGFAVATSL